MSAVFLFLCIFGLLHNLKYGSLLFFGEFQLVEPGFELSSQIPRWLLTHRCLGSGGNASLSVD